ncbi:hypothetical protein CVT24_012410 [Panaeolus cyanescens]|uniref:Retrovirus-related Pol polyprotein from transposon TNT 1-94-like beta-barrel domain-containing protein n=1 Tax=Panaeolus cyanescens TaxID=181874 RepID=A0A409YJD9_9AGAR|nr:hypothetical protein CVT24_012410 [Panaeolus cyanescens]
MGPGKSDSSYSTFLKLKEDGTNWPAYKVETLQHMYARGIVDNLDGTVYPPEQLVAHDKQIYLASDSKFKNPLDRETVKSLQAERKEYFKNEGLGTEILIATVPVSTFVQLRHHNTLSERWNALCAIYEHRGEDVSFDMWDRFNNLHFTGGSVHAFISRMSDMRDQLIINDADLTDKQFVAAIRRAFRQSEYNEYLASVCAGIRNAGKEITPAVLIQELKTEANSRHGASAISPNVKTSEALASSGSDSQRSTSNSGKKGKKKSRDSKTKPKYHCDNCGLDGHSQERCWGPGGGSHDSSPQWWRDKQAELQKKKSNFNANVAESHESACAFTESASSKPEHVALLSAFTHTPNTPLDSTTPTSNVDTTHPAQQLDYDSLLKAYITLVNSLGEGAFPYTESLDAKPEHVALVLHNLPCTRDVEPLKAPSYALQSLTSQYLGTVLDCGASDHYTPRRDLLTNFTPVKEATRVADGRIVDALGKGDLTIQVPCGKLGSTKVTLSNVYFVPSFSFTLVSIARILLNSDCQILFKKSPNPTAILLTSSNVISSLVKPGRYLGPDEQSRGIRVYWPSRHTITVEREVFLDIPDRLSPLLHDVIVEGEIPSDNHQQYIQVNIDDVSSDDDKSPPSNNNPVNFPQEDEDAASDAEVENQLLDDNQQTPPPSPPITPPPVSPPPPKPRRIMGLEVPEHLNIDINAPRQTRPRNNSVTMPGFYSDKNQESRGSGRAALLQSNISSIRAMHDEIRDQYGEDFIGISEITKAISFALASGAPGLSTMASTLRHQAGRE